MLHLVTYLFLGCLTGLMISAPIGPANLICLQKSLQFGYKSGVIAGLGAALGDFIFVIIGLAGLMTLADFQALNEGWMKYIGAFILGFFALFSFYKSYRQYHAHNATDLLLIQENIYDTLQRNPLWENLKGLSTNFMLTVTNPLTPIGVLTSVGAVGLGSGMMADAHTQFYQSLIFASGIFTGAMTWWYILCRVATIFASYLTHRFLSYIHFVGAGLMLFICFYVLFLLD